MGFYIDPANCSKEQFLAENGKHIHPEIAKQTLADGNSIPVCLVDNGIFTAAGIAYSEREIEHFSDPSDSRRKQWFAVPREKLVEFYPEAARSEESAP